MSINLFDFLNQKSTSSPFKSNLSERGGYITFSNSGQRGSVKYFSLGLDSLISTLNDIVMNLNEFSSHHNYVEGEWRDLGSQYYTDATSNAMATVQTKPLFSTLSKLIVWANSPLLDNINTDQNIVLEEVYINNTISKLNELAEEFKPKRKTTKIEILLEKEKLKWIIFKTFKLLLETTDEETLLEGYKIKESKINNTVYDGLFLPQYFGTDNLIGIYKTGQTKNDLKSSNTERYFEENIRILGNDFAYFTTQWGDTDGKYKTLINFNKYLNDKSNNTLEIIKDGNLFTLISKGNEIISSPLQKTEQKIYYGAPGTGKSYKVDCEIKNLSPNFYERITFHPEFDHTSFIGGYKPVSAKDINENDIVKYQFVSQAFTNVYYRAWNDQNNQYYLVIEEINRGNCAEIFGDIFQLLDRNSNYTVSPSDELKNHLIEKFGDKNHDGIVKGLKLPPNLSILATMNTSDQSLFPMDSAFKRRWDWEYIPICYKEKTEEEERENESFFYKVYLDETKTKYFKWIDFIEKINFVIEENENLGMDKCIGNYFIKSDTKEITLKEFVNKAIFYLWNDVFKDEDSSKSIFEKGMTFEKFFPIKSNGKDLLEKILIKNNIEILPKNI